MAKKDILPTKFPVEQEEYMNEVGKPSGLWYGIGTDWLDWVKSEMPHWKGRYFYKVYITNKVLRISNKEQFIKFINKYKIVDRTFPNKIKLIDIDWKKVARYHSGIEISPYLYEFRFKFLWYYSWDVASGCIWKRDGLAQIRRIRFR